MSRHLHPLSLTEHEVTPECWLRQRRSVLASAALLAAAAPLPWARAGESPTSSYALPGDTPSAQADVSNHTNYYEFSVDKKASKVLAQALTLRPWTLTIEGEVEKPYTVDVDELPKLFGTEERIYRLRCVEGWSAVVPWSGCALSRLIERARPSSRAKFVEFESLHRSSEMIGQRSTTLPWPYREALRIDEAMHPLAFAVTGMYGHPLTKQNGAPVRLALPWKYGFKSPKAVARIRLSAVQPTTSWNQAMPSEYGFYGNVNPAVPHPRWSQARENRLGEMQKRATQPFNGYAQWVAALYQGQDPRTLY